MTNKGASLNYVRLTSLQPLDFMTPFSPPNYNVSTGNTSFSASYLQQCSSPACIFLSWTKAYLPSSLPILMCLQSPPSGQINPLQYRLYFKQLAIHTRRRGNTQDFFYLHRWLSSLATASHPKKSQHCTPQDGFPVWKLSQHVCICMFLSYFKGTRCLCVAGRVHTPDKLKHDCINNLSHLP